MNKALFELRSMNYERNTHLGFLIENWIQKYVKEVSISIMIPKDDGKIKYSDYLRLKNESQMKELIERVYKETVEVSESPMNIGSLFYGIEIRSSILILSNGENRS